MGLNFRSLPVLIIPGNSITSQFYGQKSSHVDSPSGFTRIFIFHEKIYATNEATWPAGRLAWTPYLKITREGRYSITLHNLSCIFVMTLCKIYSFARNAEKSYNSNASKILGNESSFLIIMQIWTSYKQPTEFFNPPYNFSCFNHTAKLLRAFTSISLWFRLQNLKFMRYILRYVIYYLDEALRYESYLALSFGVVCFLTCSEC